jgi:hypothetical protein
MSRVTNITDLFKLVLKQGTLLSAAIAAFGSAIGFLVAGDAGVNSALIGAAIALAFNALTALSIWAGSKLALGGFYALVLGGWLLKIVVFMILLATLKGATFIHGPTLFFTIVACVLGGLTIDSLAILRARIPAVD